MPSLLHEALLQLFRNRPTLPAEILQQVLGRKLPAYDTVQVRDANLSQVTPTEYRADHVVLLESGAPVFGIVVEVQLKRDPDKRFTWPAYTYNLRSAFRCPCCLLVVAPDADVARWASEPIDTGQLDSPFVPHVLGPDSVPLITDPVEAGRTPELAVLSVKAHGKGPDGMRVALAAALATQKLDQKRAVLYLDLVLMAVSDAVRRKLEDLMLPEGYEFQSDFARKYFSQGEEEGLKQGMEQGLARGKTEALLTVLAARGLAMDETHRETILACRDPKLIDRWIERAARAESVGEIFE